MPENFELTSLKTMKLTKILLVVLVTLLLFLRPVQGSATDWYDLEDTYSTTNFDIFYTDDCTNYPADCIDPVIIPGFGDVLEETREGVLYYGFDESPYDYRAYINDIDALGMSWGQVSSWDEEQGEWVYWQHLQFDSNFLTTDSEENVRAVSAHEFFHLIQSHYRGYGGGWWDVRSWVIEGQAEMIMDKIFAICDEDPNAGYYWNGYWYLTYGHYKYLMDLSYGAALFWNYVTEHYGTIRTEPGYGLDALVAFWEAVESLGTPSNEIEAFNLMLSNLGHPGVTFEDVFKDFVVTNVVKDLSGPNVPAKYHHYQDETQPPGSYGVASFRRDIAPIDGYIDAGTDFVNPWAANYYRYRRDYQTSDFFEVEVNQITANELFYSLLIIKDDDLVDEIRVTGTHFAHSLNTDADEIILVVAGLANTPSNPAKYHFSLSPGGSISVDILNPDPYAFGEVAVGPYDNPETFLVILEVLDSGNPVPGLDSTDFDVRIGEPWPSDTWPSADVISSAFIYGLYFLVVQAPPQPNPGLYHLYVEVAGGSNWLNYPIEYTEQIIESVIVVDKSGSMSYDEKIDAAKAVARLYANSFPEYDYIALVQFNEDALLVKGLEEVSLSRNDILNSIDTIGADGWTSVGDGLFFAQNELFSMGDPTHVQHIVLLTDGKENRDYRIADVDQLLYGNNTILDVVLIGIDAEAYDLQLVASYTGGNVYFAFDPASGTLLSDLASIYRAIVEKTHNEQRIFSKIQQKSGPWTILESFYIDEAPTATVVFNYKATESLSKYPIILNLPNGNTMYPTFSSEKQAADSLNYYGHFVWKILKPPIGTYHINATGEGDIEYFLEASVWGPSSLNMYGLFFDWVLPPWVLPELMIGTAVPIVVSLTDILPSISEVEVIAKITTGTSYEESQTWNLHLYDDGAHGDGLPNDGVYGNYLTRTGGYGLALNQTGTTYVMKIFAKAGNFTREAMGAFHLAIDPKGDLDNDRLPDVWEQRHGLDPSDGKGVNGAEGDLDQDGLTNIDELKYGTSPTNSDTDAGGESDYSEVQYGRDPYFRDDDTITPPLIFVIPGNQNVTIFFGASSSHNSLSLYRSLDADKGYTLVASWIEPNIDNYTDFGLTNENTYYYKLMAVGATGEKSAFSSVVSATPKTDAIRPWGTVLINGGDKYTTIPSVTLDLVATSDVAEVRISNTPQFEDAPWMKFVGTISWELLGQGLQRVFVQFKDTHGNIGGARTCTSVRRPTDFATDSIIVNPNYITTLTIKEFTGWPNYAIIAPIIAMIAYWKLKKRYKYA